MKRYIKNIIVISIIVLTCAGFFFTAKAAVNSISSSMSQTFNINEEMGNPPEMSNDSSSSQSSDSESDDTTNDQQTPPDMPSGGMQDSNMTPPDMNSDSSSSDNQGTPPEMPSGEMGQGPSGNSDMGNPPEKPDGEASQTSDTQTSEDTSTLQVSTEETVETTASVDSSETTTNEERPQFDLEQEDKSISPIYYVVLGGEALVIFTLGAYMIMSRANKLTFKQTMKSADKYVIVVLSAALLTTGTLLASSKVMANVAKNTETTENMPEMSGAPEGQPGGTSTSTASYSGATTISEDTKLSDTTYTSENSDENALLVSGDITVTADGIVVEKTGDSDGGDNSNFYGTNSGILAKDGANLTITNATITTDADGANGVFSYGGSATTSNSSSDGTTVTISDSTITTTGDNAGGIMTTGGGTTIASNLTITTSGTSSAAIRTDRGGGTVSVDGGTYTTNGKGSPAVYSTADITVSNATLISNTSEGVVIEGKNSVTLENVTLTDTNDELNGQSTTYKNIFLYQSMSGDADNGTAEFSAKDSTITTNVGDSFYVTNTTATITLENNVIVNNDTTGNFLRVQADSWGNTGSNGGDVTLLLINQEADGSIVIDSISTLSMSLTEGSSFTGVINADNTAKSISLTLDASSTLTLTGDTYVTSLTDADSTYSNINFNGYTLYVNGVAIN